MLLKNDDLVEILRLSETSSYRQMAEQYGVSINTIGNFLRKTSNLDFWAAHDEKPIAQGSINRPQDTRKAFNGKRFVFTSAQNNTYVHDGWLKSLENYCKINDSQLVIGTFIYNKVGFQSGADKNAWFDPKIRPYITNESTQIAKGLVWCGDLNILPTAKTPMNTLHNYTNHDSAIIPHAKLQMVSIATPKSMGARLMYTTGCVTTRNYRPQLAGQSSEHHHSFSALIVEIDNDGDWFVRQITAEKETGNFQDLTDYYTNDSIIRGQNIEAINFGDIHSAKPDDDVALASWCSNTSMLDILRPKFAFLHDTLDQQARNHHNVKDPHFMFKMHHDKTECVRGEIELTVEIMREFERDFCTSVIVESNHDKSIEKWLKEEDYRKDPVNALFFLELQLAKYNSIVKGEHFSVFQHACNMVGFGGDDAIFLREDDTFMIANGIECAAHSHLGTNGSRGSVQCYVKTGVRHNLGHSHSATIKDGVWQAGVSGSLDMGYNTGNSSWSNSHIITYANGKRCMITIKNGKWRA